MSKEEPEIRVTRIKDRWHCRLIVLEPYNDSTEELIERVYDEMACSNQQDIGWCCRTMLRWYAKTGGYSAFADAARKRNTAGPVGKVWYRPQLDAQKAKRNKNV